MKEQIRELLKKYTGHGYVELASRGNSAIFVALYIARKINPGKVLIPDQGGWLYYRKIPKWLGMQAEEVKTDFGIIDLGDLKQKIAGASCIIYQNPAGYFAEQPMKDIWGICNGKCLVILDASGSIGNEMCDGRYADMIVGSFGKWKPVDAGYGGFISAKEKKLFEKPKEIFNLVEFDDRVCKELFERLKNAGKRYRKFDEVRRKIINELKSFDIMHRNSRGINVVVRFRNVVEKREITDYCEKNKYEYTICPRYIRANCNAVSIEVKRIR